MIAVLYKSSFISWGIVEYNVDEDAFNTWFEKILLHDLSDESVVIINNTTFQKSQKKEINSKQNAYN